MKRLFVIALFAAGFWVGEASAAALVVVDARGIALKPGTVLQSGAVLQLKQGQHVTLITETGSTLKISGPYDKPPVAVEGGGVTLSSTLQALVTQREARRGEFGTTRAATLAKLPDPWLVDATHGGSGCMLESRQPVFWRQAVDAASTLTVEPTDRSWKARATWPAGQDRLSITTDVPMRGGETYVVSVGGVESAITMVSVPAALTNDAMRTAWMAEKGCEAQATALLQTQK
ncbi:MAG: hypothetical protein AB7O49_14880 [Sphingomonadales bacterium]